MREYGFITDEQYNDAINEKIAFKNGDIKSRNEEEQISTSNVAPEFTTIVLSELRKILKISEEDQKFLFDGYKVYAESRFDQFFVHRLEYSKY